MTSQTNSKIADYVLTHLSDEGATRTDTELRVRCPFHDDKSPSLSINLVTGLWNCFAMSCPQSSGGNLAQFIALIEEIPLPEAEEKADELLGIVEEAEKPKPVSDFPVSEEEIEQASAFLMRSPVLESFKRATLYTDETIAKFQLGWSDKERRIWIPIRDDKGRLVNIRKYSSRREPKVMNVTGFGKVRLWPTFESNVVYIMEGEKDCMLANQFGLPAITATAGAGTFKTDWVPLFMGKDVIICYDIDEAGVKGAERVSRIISNAAKTIKIINLPLSKPANGDFTDFIKDKSIEAFNTLVANTPILAPRDDSEITIEDAIHETTLDKVAYQNMCYKRSRIKLRIVGKDLSPYGVPRVVCVFCNRDNGGTCKRCGIYKSGEGTIKLDETKPEILEFVDCSVKERKNIIRDAFGMPNCNKFKLNLKDHQYVDEMEAMPYIDTKAVDGDFTTQILYFLNVRAEMNIDYEVDSIAVPHPKSQKIVHIVYAVRPCETSLELFNVTVELMDKLRIFQCQKSETNLTTSMQTSQQT